MKHLKEFETATAYEAAQSSLILPNISLINETNNVKYNPLSPEQHSDPRLIVTYNVTDSSTLTKLFATNKYEAPDITFVEAEIDGMDIDVSNITGEEFKYQLSIGEHIVKYTLKDTTTIGNSTFYECDRITSVIIPDCVTTIGYSGVFADCTNLTNVTIGNGVTSIGYSAFQNCSGLTSIDIPSGVTYIDSSTFNNCTSLTSIEIPSSVINISGSAFYGCSGLTSVTIGSGVTSIGDGAFLNCSSLISVSIGTGISYIRDYAFTNDRNLVSITINATTPPTLGMHPFTNNASGRKIYVPSASVDTYKVATNWSTYASDIEAIS